MSFRVIHAVYSLGSLRAYNSIMIEFTLALGGGGTRGAAHIGVLRVLVREGCRIRGISGTSIGSIIASLFAAGYSPDQIEERVASIDFTRLYGRLLSDGPGLLGISGIHKWLEEHLGSRYIRESANPLCGDRGGHAQQAADYVHSGQCCGRNPRFHRCAGNISSSSIWTLSID